MARTDPRELGADYGPVSDSRLAALGTGLGTAPGGNVVVAWQLGEVAAPYAIVTDTLNSGVWAVSETGGG